VSQPIPTPAAPPADPAAAPPAAAPQPPAAPPAPAVAPPAPPAAPPAAPQYVPPPAPYAPPAPPPAVEPVDDGSRDISRLPQWAQKDIADLRAENASRRVAARTAVVMQHAFAAAPTLGVNGHALLGSTAFQSAAAQLDPTAADFGQQLAAKIQETLAANAWMTAQLAAPTPPARAGGEFSGGPGAGAPITEDQLAKMSPAETAKAYAEGRLSHLM